MVSPEKGGAEVSELLADKLSQLRSRDRLVAVLTGVALVAVVGMTGLAVSMGLDFLLELPIAIRVVLLVLMVGGSGYFAYLRVLIPFTDPLPEDELALWIEREHPTLRSRLISSLQLARAPNGDPSLIAALTRETESLLAPVEPATLVKSEKLLKATVGAIGVLLVMTLVLSFAPGNTMVLLQRALCVPGIEPPRKTQITLLTDTHLIVPLGEDLTLSARAGGVIPASGHLLQSNAAGVVQRFDLPRVEGTDEFSLTLKNLSESFQARIQLNDATSPAIDVKVLPRPGVKDLEIWATTPAYAGGRREKKNPGDLILLAGSTLDLSITSTKPLALTRTLQGSGEGQSRIVFVGQNNTRTGVAALTRSLSPEQSALATGKAIAIPPATTGFMVYLVDADGLESKDPVLHRLDVIPDRSPRLVILAPTLKEEVVTRSAQIRIALEAEDDVALAHLRLCYSLKSPGSEMAGPLRTIELNVLSTASDSRLFRGYYPWSLPSIGPLPEGTVIEWYIEATDNNTLTGPGVTRSEPFLTRIGTEDQVRDLLMTRLAGAMQSLEDSQQSQQDLARDLGKLITEKPLTPPRPR